MASLLFKGVQLEQRYGSLRFAALVAELLALSQALYVGAAGLLAHHIPEYRCVQGRRQGGRAALLWWLPWGAICRAAALLGCMCVGLHVR